VIVKEKKRKLTKEEKKRRKPTKKSTEVMKHLCKVDREPHSKACDSTEPTSITCRMGSTCTDPFDLV
jgi:hypothetical protein